MMGRRWTVLFEKRCQDCVLFYSFTVFGILLSGTINDIFP